MPILQEPSFQTNMTIKKDTAYYLHQPPDTLSSASLAGPHNIHLPLQHPFRPTDSIFLNLTTIELSNNNLSS